MLLTINRKGDIQQITDCKTVVMMDDIRVLATCEGGRVVLNNPRKCKELFKGHWEVVL